MPAETYAKMRRTLHVEGHLWGGGEAVHAYPIEDVAPTTLAEARRVAGDFENLTSAEVVEVVQEITETRTRHALS